MLLSGQGVLLVTGTWRQPTNGSQKSAVQTLPSSQFVGPAGVQAPLAQTSVPLHGFVSGQAVPSGTVGFAQPEVVLQLSTVHAFLSLHAARWTQPKAGPQASRVQLSMSLQSRGAPGLHEPA